MLGQRMRPASKRAERPRPDRRWPAGRRQSGKVLEVRGQPGSLTVHCGARSATRRSTWRCGDRLQVADGHASAVRAGSR